MDHRENKFSVWKQVFSIYFDKLTKEKDLFNALPKKKQEESVWFGFDVLRLAVLRDYFQWGSGNHSPAVQVIEIELTSG